MADKAKKLLTLSLLYFVGSGYLLIQDDKKIRLLIAFMWLLQLGLILTLKNMLQVIQIIMASHWIETNPYGYKKIFLYDLCLSQPATFKSSIFTLQGYLGYHLPLGLLFG